MTQEERDKKFSDCYTDLYRYVYNYCHRFVVDNGDREDVVSEAFLRVYKNLHKFSGDKGKISTWIFSIARNACIDHVRAKPYQARRGFVEIEKFNIPDKSPNPEIASVMSQRSVRLHVAIKDLNKVQREEIGFLLDGYRSVEIAKITNRAHSTVRQSIRRSKDILHGVLQGRV